MPLRQVTAPNGRLIAQEVEPFPGDRGWIIYPLVTNCPGALRTLADACREVANLQESHQRANSPQHFPELARGLCAPSPFVLGTERDLTDFDRAHATACECPAGGSLPNCEHTAVVSLPYGDFVVTVRIEPAEAEAHEVEESYSGIGGSYASADTVADRVASSIRRAFVRPSANGHSG